MKNILSIFAIILLAACSSTKPALPTIKLDFTKYGAIYFNVSRIEVVEEYKSPMHAPNVEHTITYSPADAMQLWVKDRLRAAGSDKLLQVIIKDASVVEAELPKTAGFKGYFTNDQDKRYDAKLEVELRIYGDEPLSEANAEAVVTRSITIPENATVEQRHHTLDQLVADSMELLNAKLEGNINSYMGNYTRAAH